MKEIKECLVCANKDLKVYCDMGQQPLVNNLKSSPEEKDLLYPLVVMECPVCTHKQLSVAVDRDLLFKDYLYKSGTSESHRCFFNSFVRDLGEGDKVLDVGSNDGSLLWAFNIFEWNCLGIEPCKELVEYTRRRGIPVIEDFFPLKYATNEKFDVITSFNVFAHNDDPYTFLVEMAKLLKPDGRIYILTTPARIDNFYHEHISYFTPQSMMVLAQRCGVEVISFKEVSMHGKSFLFEIGARIDVTWRGEASPCLAGTVVAYGASASETVLFNFHKICPEYTVDDNLLKQGKFIPGINSPIVSAERLAKDPRDLTIIIAHHLFDEISAKIKKLRPKHKDMFERLI